MSFTDQNKTISLQTTTVTDPDVPFTFTTCTSISGGGETVETSFFHGPSKDPIDQTEGNTVYEDLSLEMSKTQWLNYVFAKGGAEGLRAGRKYITIVVVNSNGENTTKETYTKCRFISASSSTSGTDAAMTTVTFRPTKKQTGDSFISELVGTLIQPIGDLVNALPSLI